MEGQSRYAPYAVTEADSGGRMHAEREHAYRAAFQRDRDRILHSAAFRRLEFKTQVFLPYAGDYYRTRLTHTLEVAQISRTLARALRLNEDAAEAIALAHDLGHPPFGHTGEDVLHRIMKGHGGFEHNMQSFRIVTELENRYPDFPGLNLTFAVLEGIAKHRTAYDAPDEVPGFEMKGRASLEAQVVNTADEVTYVSHDVDDGLKARILTEEGLAGLELTGSIMRKLERAGGKMDEKLRRYHLIRALIDAQVTDLIDQSRANLERARPASVEDVHGADSDLIGFSEDMARRHGEMKRYLLENFYHHARVRRPAGRAEGVLSGLFNAYLKTPDLIPEDAHPKARRRTLHRKVCDYVSGMTDRFALREYSRLRRGGGKS